jgi:ABC-type lipoprotein release transport system permease subunit
MTRGQYFANENETGIIFGQHVADDIEKHLDRQLDIGEPITLVYQYGPQTATKNFFFKGVIDPHNYVVDESILIPKEQLEILLAKHDVASFISIKTDPQIDLEKIKLDLEKLNLQAQIKTWRDFDYLNILDIVKGVKAIGNIIFLVSILATAMVVAVIIYMNILSKQRQIAIMKALGATKLNVILIFVAQAFLFTLLGIIIGNLFYLLLYKYLLIHPINMPFGDVIPSFNLKAYLIAIIIFILAAILSSLYPVYKINKESIVKAIWDIG